MSDKFTFSSAGLVHELEMAIDRAGEWNAALVKRMCEGDRLVHIREYLLGLAEIKRPEHLMIVDCDADPFVPSGWKVEEHQKGGQFKFDPAQMSLYLSKSQCEGVQQGHDLRKELAGKPVLNANVLDCLLAHPHLIPEEWKKNYTFFWGTIYRDSHGDLCVRYLCWHGGRWNWDYNWLKNAWYSRDPAALRASST